MSVEISKMPELNTEIVRKYICPSATDTEIYTFLKICEFQRLNPFLREVYLVKYSPTAQASVVTGKEVFLKRAMKHPKYRGHRAWTQGSGDEMIAKAEVYIEGFSVPITVEVDFKEYAGVSRIWKEKPKTMLRKVALVQALRESFPEELGGLYDSVEINTITEELPEKPISFEVQSGALDEEQDWAVYKFKSGPYKGRLVSDVSDCEYFDMVITHKDCPLGLREFIASRILQLKSGIKS